VVPELLQEACRPDRLAATLAELLDDAAAREAQQRAFRGVLASLAPPQGRPSEAAAAEVLAALDAAQLRP